MTCRRLAVFRADASATLGSGHVMRCVALAEALNVRKWDVAFAVLRGSVQTLPKAVRESWQWIELSSFDDAREIQAAIAADCDILVVDHYDLDVRYESACRQWAKRLVAVDDLADRKHDCDILVDPAANRRPADYVRLAPANASILTGPAFALMRHEMAGYRNARRRSVGASTRVLISFGSTDPANATERALSGVMAAGLPVGVDVVLGRAAPHIEAIERLTKQFTQVRLHIDPKNLPELMVGADLAIGGGGSSAWERCCLGLPALIVTTANNQRETAEGLDQLGAARLIGCLGRASTEVIASEFRTLLQSKATLDEMSSKAAAVCDGNGAARVAALLCIDAMADDGRPVALRLATSRDGDLVYQWQSHPETRRFSHNSAVPSRSEHDDWFARKLQESGCHFHIVLHGNEPAGVLRLDRVRSAAERYRVSIAMAATHTRLGLGRIALDWAREYLPRAELVAEILPANTASHALFRAAGYRRTSDLEYELKPTG